MSLPTLKSAAEIAAEERSAKDAARIRQAWSELAENEGFKTAFYLDLQAKFPPFAPTFQAGDGYNPHAAAMREGARQVINHIYAQIHRKPSDDED